MSVARTNPSAPACCASHAGTDAPPAPTSQQRHPGRMPSATTCRRVTSSKSAESASNLAAA
jgi:hypothetical protein